MNVYEAVGSRRSIRDFLDKPVDAGVIRKVLSAAARSASGGNLQPWHIDVVAGARLDELKAVMQRRLQEVAAGRPLREPCSGKSQNLRDREILEFLGETAIHGNSQEGVS